MKKSIQLLCLLTVLCLVLQGCRFPALPWAKDTQAEQPPASASTETSQTTDTVQTADDTSTTAEADDPALVRYVNFGDRDYLKKLYSAAPSERIFPVSKHYLKHEMARGCKETGVKQIRIHDIRHSHVSLLIDMGFSATAIADRVGHESVDITYHYAHLFPSRQAEMADKLNMERGVEYVGKEQGRAQPLA